MGAVVQLQTKNSVVQDFLEQFRSKETRRAYESTIKSFFGVDDIRLINNLKLQIVRSSDAQSWIKIMIKENKSSSTIKRNVSCMNSLYDYALEEGLVSSNPFGGKRIEKLIKLNSQKGEVFKGVALDKNEIKQLLGGIENIRDKVLIKFMLKTGLRVSEVVNVKWEDIINVNEKWFIKVIGKGNKIRHIGISNDMKDELEEYFKWKNNDLIFNMTTRNVNYILKKWCEKTGVRIISAHDTRRTFITNLKRNGADLFELQQIAGHSSINTTKKYFIEDDIFENNAARLVDW